MPELPEVETVVRGLATVLDGHVITRLALNRADLRFPFPAGLIANVEGRRVVAVRRRAKYILIALDDGATLMAHLGMSGRMVISRDEAPGDARAATPANRHDHVVFTTDAGITIRFNDPRRFGFLDYRPAGLIETHPMLASLGPEPLTDAFTGPFLAAKLAGKMTSIKAALLDQQIVAGLGNIYVCESLFWARLSPRRVAASIAGTRAERLVGAIKQVLTKAIAAGGSSLRDYVQTSGELGYFQHQWAVYGKEGERCPDCICGFEPETAAKRLADALLDIPPATLHSGGIKRIVQSNRSTFFCPRRQR